MNDHQILTEYIVTLVTKVRQILRTIYNLKPSKDLVIEQLIA